MLALTILLLTIQKAHDCANKQTVTLLVPHSLGTQMRHGTHRILHQLLQQIATRECRKRWGAEGPKHHQHTLGKIGVVSECLYQAYNATV